MILAQYSHPNHIGCPYCTEIYLQRESSSVPRRVFSLLCLPVSPLLSLPNRTCTQHTMLFATWSTLTNTFIISTVALLSLIQVAKATAELDIVTPNNGQRPSYPEGPVTIRWYVPSRAGSQGRDTSLMAGISGTSTTLLNYLESMGSHT
jgi:hypothetical protein